jgi:hypothetical protein
MLSLTPMSLPRKAEGSACASNNIEERLLMCNPSGTPLKT